MTEEKKHVLGTDISKPLNFCEILKSEENVQAIKPFTEHSTEVEVTKLAFSARSASVSDQPATKQEDCQDDEPKSFLATEEAKW